MNKPILLFFILLATVGSEAQRPAQVPSASASGSGSQHGETDVAGSLNSLIVNAKVILPEEFLVQPAKAYPVLFYLLESADPHPFYSLAGDEYNRLPMDTLSSIRIFLGRNPLSGRMEDSSDRKPVNIQKPDSPARPDREVFDTEGGCLDLSMYGEAIYLLE